MARIDFTSLREAAQNFMASAEGALTDLLGIANGQRKELISLYQRMTDTQADIKEFSEIAAEIAETFDGITDVAEDVAMKVGNAIEGGADLTPDCDYEVLVDFCDECGKAIVEGEDYEVNAGDWYTCEHCLKVYEDQAQMTIDDLKETTHEEPTEETSAE